MEGPCQGARSWRSLARFLVPRGATLDDEELGPGIRKAWM